MKKTLFYFMVPVLHLLTNGRRSFFLCVEQSGDIAEQSLSIVQCASSDQFTPFLGVADRCAFRSRFPNVMSPSDYVLRFSLFVLGTAGFCDNRHLSMSADSDDREFFAVFIRNYVHVTLKVGTQIVLYNTSEGIPVVFGYRGRAVWVRAQIVPKSENKVSAAVVG